MTDQPSTPLLPVVWSGSWIGSSWGIGSNHHPRSHSHGELEPEWHAWTAPWSMRIARQEGRHLQLFYRTDNHESRAVAVLSADCRRMVLTGEVAIYHFDVDLEAGTMVGQWTARPHGSDRVGSHFACGEVEIAVLL